MPHIPFDKYKCKLDSCVCVEDACSIQNDWIACPYRGKKETKPLQEA